MNTTRDKKYEWAEEVDLREITFADTQTPQVGNLYSILPNNRVCTAVELEVAEKQSQSRHWKKDHIEYFVNILPRLLVSVKVLEVYVSTEEWTQVVPEGVI